MDIPKLEIGASAIVQKRIEREDTALEFGSGKLDNLLATPTLTALMIEAAVKAVDDDLPEDLVTAGKYMEVEHQKPTILGMVVSVKAELTKQDGSNLFFDIKAFDEIGLVGKGRIVRAIVNKKNLIKRANERASKTENDIS